MGLIAALLVIAFRLSMQRPLQFLQVDSSVPFTRLSNMSFRMKNLLICSPVRMILWQVLGK